MRVFIDVGGHHGQSLLEALHPRYGFEQIHTIEPSRACVERLQQFRDRRIVVHHCGLGKAGGEAVLHGAGHKGASLFLDKPAAAGFDDETIRVVDVAEWMRAHVSPADENYLKLNCEGAEADILERMADAGQAGWFKGILLSMDIEKIPSQQGRTASIKALAQTLGNVSFRESYIQRSTRGSLTVWLNDVVPAVTPSFASRVRYALGLHLDGASMIRQWKQRIRAVVAPFRGIRSN